MKALVHLLGELYRRTTYDAPTPGSGQDRKSWARSFSRFSGYRGRHLWTGHLVTLGINWIVSIQNYLQILLLPLIGAKKVQNQPSV